MIMPTSQIARFLVAVWRNAGRQAAFLALVCASVSPTLEAAPILVTDLDGEVLRGKQEVSLLASLSPRDEVTLRTGARAVVTYLPEAREFSLIGPGMYRIGANAVTPLKGAPAPGVRELPVAYRNIRIDTAHLGQAGIRLRGEAAVAVLQPQGLVAEAPQRFTWPAVADAEGYVFRLANEKRDLIFEARLTEPALSLPESIKLRPGARYVWGVEAPGSGQEPRWTQIHLARDAAGTRRLQEARPTRDAPRSERVLFALATETAIPD
jgi:hypothetical protein